MVVMGAWAFSATAAKWRGRAACTGFKQKPRAPLGLRAGGKSHGGGFILPPGFSRGGLCFVLVAFFKSKVVS